MSIDTVWGGIGIFMGLFLIFFGVALIVVSIVANWTLFKKAGKEGWEAIVPFYNNWVLVEIAGLNWWWFLLILAPSIASFINEDIAEIASLANLFAIFNCYYNLAKKFKKSTSTSVVAGIFSFIFTFIFAFSKSETYYATEKVSSNGVFPGEPRETSAQAFNSTDNNNNPNLTKFCMKCGCKIEDHYKFCSVCGNEIERK